MKKLGVPHFCEPIFVMTIYGIELSVEKTGSRRTRMTPNPRRIGGIEQLPPQCVHRDDLQRAY